jgi:hypothetical protein
MIPYRKAGTEVEKLNVTLYNSDIRQCTGHIHMKNIMGFERNRGPIK